MPFIEPQSCIDLQLKDPCHARLLLSLHNILTSLCLCAHALTEDECVDAVEAAPEAWPMDQFSTIDLSVLDANFPVAEVCACWRR